MAKRIMSEKLEKACGDYIKVMKETNFIIDHNIYAQFIAEEALKAIYGKNVFKEINKALLTVGEVTPVKYITSTELDEKRWLGIS